MGSIGFYGGARNQGAARPQPRCIWPNSSSSSSALSCFRRTAWPTCDCRRCSSSSFSGRASADVSEAHRRENWGEQRLLRRSSRCQHSQNSAVRRGMLAGQRARASGERCGRTLPRREPLLPDLPGLVHRFDDKERRPEHILLPRGARRGGAAGMGWLVLCGTAQRHPTKGAATAQNDVNMKISGGVQRAAYRPRPQSSPCRGRNPGQNPSKQRSTEGRGCVAAHSVPPCSALSVALSQTEDAASRIAAA